MLNDAQFRANLTKNHAQLNDKELETLEKFLVKLGSDSMSIEMVDGFFVALNCTPSIVPPSEYLPVVYGEGSFENLEEAQTVMSLLMRHWNWVATELLKTLSDHEYVYDPILMEDSDGMTFGNEWAIGFLRGLMMRREDWLELMQDEEKGGVLIPMMMLAHEHDEDPEMRPEPIDAKRRTDLIIPSMIGFINSIYAYFEPYRRRGHLLDRDAGKINVPSRNALCSCGSGKKYKRCCGKNEGWSKTIH